MHLLLVLLYALLPDGIKITLKDGELTATQKDVSVKLPRGEWSGKAGALGKVELDGETITVTYTNCVGDDGAQAIYGLAEVRARLENSRAMVLHRKKDYARAAAGFGKALELWPEFDLAAVNLASALALQGKKKEAAAALVPLARRNPAWLAWRLDVDPELASVKGAAELVALVRGATPGGATVAQLANGVAWDSDHKLVATVAGAFNGGPGGVGTTDLVVIDPSRASGAIVVRIPLTTVDDYQCKDDEMQCSLSKKGQAAGKKRDAEANRLLDTVGFVMEQGAVVKAENRDDLVFEWKSEKVRLADGKDGWEVTRNGRIVGKADPESHVNWAALLPGYVVVSTTFRGGEGCMGVQPDEFTVIKLDK